MNYAVKLGVEMIREDIEHDLEVYEEDKGGKYLFLVYHKDVGMTAPFDWLNPRLSDYQDKWEKFMEGQTYCMGGFYVRDVLRFLIIVERHNDSNTG